MLCIPPLPTKQVRGRFEADFVAQRCRGLQTYLNRLLRHPILRQAAILNHFLTCNEDIVEG